MLTRHVGLLRSTARGPMSISLAANDDHGTGHRLVPGKNRDHARTLALGPLSIQLPAATPAAGAGCARCFGRSAGRSRPSVPTAIRRFARCWPKPPASWCLPMLNNCKPATIRKISSRSSCCRSSASFAMSNRTRWRSRGPERRPLALVLTKADKCDGLDDNPREFAEGHAAALWNDCRDAVSAARGLRVFGRRRDGLSRQLRSTTTGAAADRAARNHRAVWLVDDGTG